MSILIKQTDRQTAAMKTGGANPKPLPPPVIAGEGARSSNSELSAAIFEQTTIRNKTAPAALAFKGATLFSLCNYIAETKLFVGFYSDSFCIFLLGYLVGWLNPPMHVYHLVLLFVKDSTVCHSFAW